MVKKIMKAVLFFILACFAAERICYFLTRKQEGKIGEYHYDSDVCRYPGQRNFSASKKKEAEEDDDEEFWEEIAEDLGLNEESESKN